MRPEYFTIRRHFRDFDEFSQTAHAWNLNIHQLGRGRFDGDLFQFGTVFAQVAYAAFHPDTHQQGEPPQGLRTLGILSDPSSHLIWRRKTIPANAVMVFPLGAELDAVSIGGRLEVLTLSFSDELLAGISRLAGFLDLKQMLNGEDVIAVSPQAITEIRRFLHQICRELQKNPAKIENLSLRYELEFELPRKLLAALSGSRQIIPKPNVRARDLALTRIEDYLAEFPNDPHTVRDLCQVANVSERNLQYAFRERFGISPKSYLMALRLNGVRRDLRRADPASTRITDLAIKWGFWHMSQFAADYRRFFGELPSNTINLKN
jgi:AraC family ethanolamine operon transcriptional activator